MNVDPSQQPPSSQFPEQELVALLQRRDDKAFSYLYDQYAGALFGVILGIIHEPQQARDLLQETFVKIWSHLDRYDPARGRLFTWMLNIARNGAIDELRSRRHQEEQQIRSLDSNVNLDKSSLSVSQRVDHIGLRAVLEGLGEEQRKIIDLAYFQGYTQQEIASKLDMPLGTVKTRVRKALIQLRGLLK